MPELELKKWRSSPKLNKLRRTQWSPEFEELMRNRLIVGSIRYGLLNDKTKRKYDRIDSVIKRAKLYQSTGNDEYLVDIANLVLLEFEEGEHPQKHFKALDDKGHVKEK